MERVGALWQRGGVIDQVGRRIDGTWSARCEVRNGISHGLAIRRSFRGN